MHFYDPPILVKLKILIVFGSLWVCQPWGRLGRPIHRETIDFHEIPHNWYRVSCNFMDLRGVSYTFIWISWNSMGFHGIPYNLFWVSLNFMDLRGMLYSLFWISSNFMGFLNSQELHKKWISKLSEHSLYFLRLP